MDADNLMSAHAVLMAVSRATEYLTEADLRPVAG